jgi:hypothetical protein
VEDFKRGGNGQQQQEHRLPDQFHERIGRYGDELSHLPCSVLAAARRME